MTMPTYKLHQSDAFSSISFKGNPAAVVTDADGLSDSQMSDIASEMNLAETAFVFKPDSRDNTFRIRFITVPENPGLLRPGMNGSLE